MTNNIMKATIRIPTVQFGYIELEVPLESKDGLIDIETPLKVHNDMVAAYEKTKAEVQKLKDDNF